jgi:hypothetical protein
MSFTAETQISTEEYGLMAIKDIHKHKLQCKILSFDTISKAIEYRPYTQIIEESRSSMYVINTFKYNRAVFSGDTLIFTGEEWKTPGELEVGNEIWISLNRIMVTDSITDIQKLYTSSKMYYIEMETSVPYFANKILIKNI